MNKLLFLSEEEIDTIRPPAPAARPKSGGNITVDHWDTWFIPGCEDCPARAAP